MFGYIRPRTDELRVRDEASYRAAYCGLCRSLGKRYGMICRFLVNYDVTFLYLLLAAQEDTQPCRACFCPANPFRRKKCVAVTPAMEYAADVCVLLCVLSLDDGRRDSRGVKRLAPALAYGLLRGALKKVEERRPALAKLAKTQLASLRELEAQKCESMDRAADAFAGLLSHCADAFLPEEKRPVQQLLYHVGRFIYLTDALDDLPKDAKSGSYNPLLYRFPCPEGRLSQQDRAYVCRSIDDSVGMAAAALELCEMKQNREILHNIVYLGMPAVLRSVDRGTFHAKRKMKDTGEL